MTRHYGLTLIYLLLAITMLPAASAKNKKPLYASLPLNQAIEKSIQHRLPTAHTGVQVIEAQSGKVIYQRNAKRAFIPASNTKLFTAAAALLQLQPEHRFTTQVVVAHNKKQQAGVLHGDLSIRFSGDPSLRWNDIVKLLKSVKDSGIKTVKGRIYIDDSAYKKPHWAAGWSYDDIGWYYAAPVSSVIVDENYFLLNIKPAKTVGQKVKLLPVTSQRFLGISNNVVTVKPGQYKQYCDLELQVDPQNHIYLTGCWPQNRPLHTFKIALNRPELWIAQRVQAQLKKLGITHQGKLLIGDAKLKNTKILATHYSKPIAELIKPVLKQSNNIYSESLFKAVAYDLYQQGNFPSGSKAMKAVLKKSFQLKLNKAVIKSGSGLSRYDLVSPELINQLLFAMEHHRYAKIYQHALAKAGFDGTLKYRMKNVDFVAKTGTMSGVSALSGYLTTKKNKRLIVSILTNQIVGKSRRARVCEEEIVRLLSERL